VNRDKLHGPQILLVDDNATNLQVLYQTLEGNGYRLLAARSGKDAIAIAEPRWLAGFVMRFQSAR